MAKRKGEREDLLLLAFAEIAEKGADGFSRAALARRSGRRLSEIHAEFPTRGAVIRQFGKRMDLAMLAIDSEELEQMTVRERLFELIMRRLEAMRPYREGLRRLASGRCGDPEMGLAALGNVRRLTGWLAESAGGPVAGLRGCAARSAILAVYASTFRVWLRDTSDDLAKTMASLDRNLDRLEQFVSWGGRLRPARNRQQRPPSPEAPEPA